MSVTHDSLPHFLDNVRDGYGDPKPQEPKDVLDALNSQTLDTLTRDELERLLGLAHAALTGLHE